MPGEPTPMQSSGGSRHVQQHPNSQVSPSISLCITSDLSRSDSLSDIEECRGFFSEDEVMDDDVSEGEECVPSMTAHTVEEVQTRMPELQSSSPSEHWKIPKYCTVCQRIFSEESVLMSHLCTSHKRNFRSNYLTRQRREGRSNLLSSASTGSLPNIPAIQRSQPSNGIVLREGTVARTDAILEFTPVPEYNPYLIQVVGHEEGPSPVEERMPVPRSVTISDQVPAQAPVQAPVQVVPTSAPLAEGQSESNDDVDYDSEGPETSQWEECSEDEVSELEEEVNKAMETSLALMALEAGLEVEQVRHALKVRLLYNRVPFESSDDLVMQVLEGRSSGEESEESVSEQQSSKVPSASNYLTRLRREGRSNLLASASSGSLLNIPAVQRLRLSIGTVMRTGHGALVGRDHSPVMTDAATSRGSNNSPRSESNKNARVCVVCLEEEARTVFLPCRHGVCCTACASRLEECPACRQYIFDKIDVFFS